MKNKKLLVRVYLSSGHIWKRIWVVARLPYWLGAFCVVLILKIMEKDEYAESLKYFAYVIGIFFLLFIFGVIQQGFPPFFSRLTLEDFYSSTIILAGLFVAFHILRQITFVKIIYKKFVRTLDSILGGKNHNHE